MARRNMATESAEMRKSPNHCPESLYSWGLASSIGAEHACGQGADTMRKQSQASGLLSEAVPVATVGGRPGKARSRVVADAAPPTLEPKTVTKKRAAKVAPAAPPDQWPESDLASHEQAVIDAALAIVAARMSTERSHVGTIARARDMAALMLGHLDHECFGVFFLDSQCRLIRFEPMFRGTLTQTSVYPREVARLALRLNAGAVLLTHNHPSGTLMPSEADEKLTRQLKEVLALFDVRVLDHIIVGGAKTISMAALGLV
jgi:RadC-like JAB domain